MCEGVYLVVVGGVGESGAFFDEVVAPWFVAGEVDVSCFDEGLDDVGAGFFAALWLDWDESGQGVREGVDDGWAVGFVFDEVGGGLWPACRELLHVLAGFGEGPAASCLVEEAQYCAVVLPYLPDDPVGVFAAFEGEVP